MTPTEQRMSALSTANTLRMAGAQLKREVTAQTMSVAEALQDPRGGVLTVSALLRAVPHIGHARASQILVPWGISPDRRVRHLTERQRAGLANDRRLT